MRAGRKVRVGTGNMQGVRATDAVRETDRARAFADYYRRQYGAVLAFAIRRLSDHETAREIALDVFRAAWTDFDPAAEPTRAWLLAVARNRIGDAYRRRDRERRLLSALRTEALTDGPAELPDPRVAAALHRLPAGAREVLVLTYWDGLPAAEAARVLGCSQAAVWVRLHRARAAFERMWNEEEPT